MTSNLAHILKAKKMARRIGKLNKQSWKKMYEWTCCLRECEKLARDQQNARSKNYTFLQQKDAHTKYRQIQRKFPRHKVIAYEINEIWSIDVAYVDKLAKYNNGVKYLLVAVDVLSKLYQCDQKVLLALLKHSKRCLRRCNCRKFDRTKEQIQRSIQKSLR